MKASARRFGLFQVSWLGIFLLMLGHQAASAANAPNFVFIITDDISAEYLGVYGNTRINTPNLDRIAQMGLVFGNAFLTTNSCSPSRNSIITDRYPHRYPAAQELWVKPYKVNHSGPVYID